MKNILDVKMPFELTQDDLERVSCPICENDSNENHFELKINGVSFYLAYCKIDDLWWVNPRPPASYYKRLYEEVFYSSPCPDHFGYASHEKDGERRRLKAAKNIDDIEKYISNENRNSFFEIGCASGELLEEVLSRGWNVAEGVEIDKECCDNAIKKGLSIYEGFFESINFNDKKYNIIFSDNVIEHVLNPDLVFKTCRNLQSKGNLLIFRLPDTQHPGPTLKLIDHTYHYTRTSITKIFEKYGYKVIDIIYSGTYLSEDKLHEIKNMTIIGEKT